MIDGDVAYAITGELDLHVPMGHGTHTVPLGPGKVVLRFHGNEVTLIAYEMHETFTIDAHAGPFSTHVTTDANATSNAVMHGTLEGNVVRWREPLHRFHTDGTLTCSGFCGKFGLPPHGASPFHVGASDQAFDAFVFDAEMKTFTMAKVRGARPDDSTMPTAFTLKGTTKP
jgi:hypothetical protein